MRAAILTLLFDGLRGERGGLGRDRRQPRLARRVAEARLPGAGRSTVSPRGTPVEHHDLLLAREQFSGLTFAVSIDGLAGLEPLFGVDWWTRCARWRKLARQSDQEGMPW